jgi:hypothetical protein
MGLNLGSCSSWTGKQSVICWQQWFSFGLSVIASLHLQLGTRVSYVHPAAAIAGMVAVAREALCVDGRSVTPLCKYAY